MPRSRSDVVSRVKRLLQYLDPLEPKSEDELELRIKEVGRYAHLSVAVRSQVKRAAILYREFAGDANLWVAEPDNTAPTFIDLFAGAGGLSLGLTQAGWKPLLAIDNWEDAVKTYRKNFRTHRMLSIDVSQVDGDELVDMAGERPTWLVGGPPCQGFSTVGKRIRQDPRNQMIDQFLRLVKEVEPEGVLIENVLGLRDMNFVSSISSHFLSIGYRVTPTILKAADHGVPQLRRRILFIAHQSGRLFIPPRPSHQPDEYVTVWDAIGDLPPLRPGEAAYRYDVPPQTDYQEAMRMGSKVLQGHQASRHPNRLVKAISYIPDVGNRRSIPNEYQPKSGFHNSYSRLHSRSPAVAVTQNMGKPSGTRCIHPSQHRGLTAREGARLQGFPDSYHFEGGITSQRLQIANAVPPVLARRLAWAIADGRNWSESDCVLAENDFFSGQLALPLEDLAYED